MTPAAPIASSIQTKIRSLPIELWPEADRNAWISACQPSQRLKRGGAGSHMKPITRDDLGRRYGYFLDCMNRRGLLDPNKAAGGHVTGEGVDAYLAELNSRVGSVTAYGSIYKLRRACELIDPARDLSWLADVEKDLALVMRPRSKSDRWVLTEVLVEAGLTLITEAENSHKMSKLGQARQVRNGLMVAMLAMHPIRLKNFAALEIGRSLLEIKSSWWIVLKSIALISIHIFIRTSSFAFRSHALAWQTTSRSAGLVSSDRSKNVSGSFCMPSDTKNASP